MALPDNIQNIDVQDLLEKPIWQMTGKEFLALSNAAAKQAIQEIPKVQPETETSQPSRQLDESLYAFGLTGIGRLLGVGKTTAQHYKNTFLKPAIIQNGQRIAIERCKALQLYEEYRRSKCECKSPIF